MLNDCAGPTLEEDSAAAEAAESSANSLGKAPLELNPLPPCPVIKGTCGALVRLPAPASGPSVHPRLETTAEDRLRVAERLDPAEEGRRPEDDSRRDERP
jgi:hypothetical protein